MKPKKLVFKKGVAETPIGDYVYYYNSEFKYMLYYHPAGKDFYYLYQSIGDYKTKTQAIKLAQFHYDNLAWSCFDEVNDGD